MVSLRRRRALGALAPALLLLLPSAASAQCQHMNSSRQTGGGPMPQMGMMRFQVPRMSMMQTQQMQMFALQQVQLLALQQMQLVAMQQQMLTMRQMELIALRQQDMSLIQQQPTPRLPVLQAAQPPLDPSQQKQYGALLREMTALQQRLEALEQAGQRGELQPQQASDAQHAVNEMQVRVAALPKAPGAVLDRMSALREQSDSLLQQVSAKPADLIELVRGAR